MNTTTIILIIVSLFWFMMWCSSSRRCRALRRERDNARLLLDNQEWEKIYKRCIKVLDSTNGCDYANREIEKLLDAGYSYAPEENPGYGIMVFTKLEEITTNDTNKTN